MAKDREMQSKKLAKGKPQESTQKYLDVAEVRSGTIVMRDGSLRGVIAVSSINFSLKSEDEQKALIASFQSFLNSLDFPIQILIRSRVLDIDSYLEKLKVLASGQTNELLRIQMSEYIEFVGKLVEFASIMSKTFYVVVPYSVDPVKQGLLARVKKVFNPAGEIKQKQEEFAKTKSKLEERIVHVTSKLSGMGLRSIVLKTDELIELLYSSYNFEGGTDLHGEVLGDVELAESRENEAI